VIQQALLQMAARDYAGARASAEEVLKTESQDERAVRVIAESYLAQNQPAKALDRLSQLAEANPGSPRIRHMLGLWQLRAGNPVAARKQFEAARRADGGFTAADVALADLDRRQDRAGEARVRLREVLAKEPRNVSALLLVAEIEKSSGDHAAAIERYRTILAFDSLNLVALNNISTELTSGNPDEALGFAQKALEIAPENAAVQDTLGWIYYRKGIYQTAAKHLKEAVSREPNPRRQFHLGMSYIKTGDLRQGRELLQAALQQDPSLNSVSQ
jgi:Tfp pilus assembly protein PilF